MSKEIYFGPRGDVFKTFIRNILKLGDLKPHYIDVLLSEDGLKLYNQAFTSLSADPEYNYEYFEMLGDVTVNKSIVWWLSRRFPSFNKPEAVPVMARLKIKLQKKETLFEIGEKMNFFHFITASEEERQTKKKNLTEDSVESFIGVTEYLIDTKIRQGVGYHICYTILKKIFDNMKISVKFEDLFDAKTRLKETFDWHRLHLKPLGQDKWQELIYDGTYDETKRIFNIVAYNKSPNGKLTAIGYGSAALKKDAEQRAAQDTINNFQKTKGYIRPVPQIYIDIANEFETN